MVSYYKALLRGVASHYQQNLATPYKDLPPDFQRALIWGSGETEIDFNFFRAGRMTRGKPPVEGVVPNLQRLYHESESEFTRNRLKAFMGPRFCNACKGQRLKPEILAVRLGTPGAADAEKTDGKAGRSEERRVGKECRSRWSPY